MLRLTILTFLLVCLISNASNVQFKYPTSLAKLLSDSKTKYNDAILGNPLLYRKCYHALIDEHKHNLNYLANHGLPQPWFWSRESIDAVSKSKTLQRVLKVSHALELKPKSIIALQNVMTMDYVYRDNVSKQQKMAKQNADTVTTNSTVYLSPQKKLQLMNDVNKNVNKNVYYYHIPKTASSTIGGSILGKHMNFSGALISENALTKTSCGFTWVRQPIDRFVSAYYTVNRLIYGHNLEKKKNQYDHWKLFKWYNVTGEPQRISAFIDDLLQFKYDFIETTPLEHVSSQSGLLSIPQSDIHFIGRLSKLKEHWNLLREVCDDIFIDAMPNKHIQRMASYGTRHIEREEFKPYAKMMGLLTYKTDDVLPGYKAIADDYTLYHKLVEYYKQDFVCFGFEPNFIEFRNKIYNKKDV